MAALPRLIPPRVFSEVGHVERGAGTSEEVIELLCFIGVGGKIFDLLYQAKGDLERVLMMARRFRDG